MLPIPHHPNIIGVDVCLTYEVVGGMDGGGGQEKITNLQERVSKEETSPHVLYEGLDIDHRLYHRAMDNST